MLQTDPYLAAMLAFAERSMFEKTERKGPKGEFTTTRWASSMETFQSACWYYDLGDLVPALHRAETRDVLASWVTIAVTAANEGRIGNLIRETAEEEELVRQDALARAEANKLEAETAAASA